MNIRDLVKQTRDALENKPMLVEPLYYDKVAENLPDSDRYFYNREEYQKALNSYIETIEEILNDMVKVLSENEGKKK